MDEQSLRSALILGDERTFEQDPKYAIRLLVDIAIKALSPAINDPSTAVQALDQLEDLLRRLGQRRLETGAFRDRDGTLRLVVPYPSWDDFLTLAFDEIRHCGAGSVQIMRRMKALAADLARGAKGRKNLTPKSAITRWHHGWFRRDSVIRPGSPVNAQARMLLSNGIRPSP